MKTSMLVLLCCIVHTLSWAEDGDQEDFVTNIRPLLEQKCFECHRTNKFKGGLNLEKYEKVGHILTDGERWLKILSQIKSRDMPPDTKPSLTEDEYMSLTQGIDRILENSLKQKDPSRIVARRLSHSEYQYTIEDLFGIEFDAGNFFPADGSGGGGFNNQARALYMTPLKLERYYEATESLITQLSNDPKLWKNVVPFDYEITLWDELSDWVNSILYDEFELSNPPHLAAKKVIVPIASKAYRRFLKKEEEDKLMNLFMLVYQENEAKENPVRFNESIAQVLKAMLMSPNFLYRIEEENDKETPFPIAGYELASRLSYFLWSSVPDNELLQLAYEEKLQDTLVLEQQVRRMLNDPRAKRFAKDFSSQWFGINKLTESRPLADPEKFPEFTPSIRQAMYDEAVSYFYYVLTESKDFMELINSDYTFLNKELASFYGLPSVEGDSMRMVSLADRTRGGMLGMGGVLTVSSLPTRTSPVLRGKWVLEEILGTPPPPPPPNVGELPEDEAALKDIGLRKLLELHRSKPECQSCHEKMDPLGLGLENFDAIGRWRENYGHVEIDPSGVMANGKSFSGPAELKAFLSEERESFARNLSSKMLSYALGRSIRFSDEAAIRELETCLLNNDFHSEKFIIALVKSYPFRLKTNDFREKKTAA